MRLKTAVIGLPAARPRGVGVADRRGAGGDEPVVVRQRRRVASLQRPTNASDVMPWKTFL